jgi:aprataxin
MAPKKPKPSPKPASSNVPYLNSTESIPHKIRTILNQYITKPESFPPSIVLYYNDSFVLLRDQYPKASIHLLLLPRDPDISARHPLEALQNDVEFRSLVKKELDERVTPLVANELRRMFGAESDSDKGYQEDLEQRINGEGNLVDIKKEDKSSEATPEAPGQVRHPRGRDWLSTIRTGIHFHPSLSNLHVHIITEDMHSPSLKHRKHYNSFNTPFFVPVSAFPLPENDERLNSNISHEYLKRDLVCWRCGENYGGRFVKLKEHLETEWEAWKKE